ncbi:MAG: ABC transporter ATP-binding protein [Brachymonas sp.]|nr:ABC transporter ATP-binding protein [Brachymonas sp.]
MQAAPTPHPRAQHAQKASAPPRLLIESLAFSYTHPLFLAFSARLDTPGIYGLFGRNGSGKSTLLKLLCGLLTPFAGRIEVLGYTPRERAAEFLEQIYILPEEFHLPNLTPDALRQTHASFYPYFDRHAFDTYLHELEVPCDQPFGAMSLGQKKKATIAFALATLTPVLLMDEPTNGLDIVSRNQFRKLMARPEHAQRTVLISTHQAHDLESILSHIWFIDNGKLVLSSSMQALSDHLRMGVAASTDELPENVLYQEPIGQQIAWVAARASHHTASPAQLELLYKALNMNKQAMLNAINRPAAEQPLPHALPPDWSPAPSAKPNGADA